MRGPATSNLGGTRPATRQSTKPGQLAQGPPQACCGSLALEQAERQAQAQEKAAYQAGMAEMVASGQKPPRTLIGGADEDDEAAD